MEMKERYRNAVNDMMTRRSFALNEVCADHHIGVVAGTILLKLGWVSRVRGSRKKKWSGPNRLSESDFDGFIELVRQHKRETRKNAPSMMPGARQERKYRQEKYQGRRTDLEEKQQRRSISLLWGLIRFNY